MAETEYRWNLVFETKAEKNDYIQEGRVSKVLINEQWICLVQSNDILYAFDESCPHQGHPLVHGHCENGKIECPLHRYQFDLKTGQGHGLSLQTYPVKEEDGKVYVAFKKNFWN